MCLGSIQQSGSEQRLPGRFLTRSLQMNRGEEVFARAGTHSVPALTGEDESLIYGVFRGVSVAGHDVDLYVLALLVLHFQRPAIGANHLHLQLAVGSIEL